MSLVNIYHIEQYRLLNNIYSTLKYISSEDERDIEIKIFNVHDDKSISITNLQLIYRIINKILELFQVKKFQEKTEINIVQGKTYNQTLILFCHNRLLKRIGRILDFIGLKKKPVVFFSKTCNIQTDLIKENLQLSHEISERLYF